MITPASLHNLLATKELLQQGVEIKPGRLNVLWRLCKEEKDSRGFLLFLLRATRVELPDISLVQRYFEDVNELVGNDADSVENVDRLKNIANELRSLQPRQKRVHVHATRRRVEYVDLYFLENVIHGLTAEKRLTRSYYCFEAAKLFVFDYDDMRYRVGGKILPRWNAIVGYWQDTFMAQTLPR